MVRFRYALFFGGFRQDRYYWECIVALRKESTVLLAVFGPNMGTPMLAHVSLLVFSIQILIQLMGSPYTSDQHKLQVLDIASICVCWFTMWSGFFFYTPRPDDQKTALEALTMIVVLVNVIHMCVLVGSMLIEICKETKENELLKSIRRRTDSLVPTQVRNIQKRLTIQRSSQKHRMSFDFENPSLGAVDPTNTQAIRNEIVKTSNIELTVVKSKQKEARPPRSSPEIISPIFMASPPPAPTKKNTSEQSEQIRKGRLKSLNARRRSKEKGQGTRDVAYSNPMKSRKQKGVGDVDVEITIHVDRVE